MVLGLWPAGVVASEGEVATGFVTEPMISAGWRHTIALRNDGTVWAWGNNFNGQLGDGTTTNSVAPVQVQSLSNVIAIATGREHTVALRQDGTVWAWGLNAHGQLGVGSTVASNTPVQVRELDNVTAIAVGDGHNVALREDGTTWTWGNGSVGQLGNGVRNTFSTTPVQVQNLSDVTTVAAGHFFTLALGDDGTVWAWGRNNFGQLGNGRGGWGTADWSGLPVQVQNLNNATAIAAGGGHAVALRENGTVWTWGNNFNGQLGDGTTADRNTPVQVRNLRDVTAIAGGANHTVSLRDDGTVWTWGWNRQGQLGDGTTTQRNTPVWVRNLSDVTEIAACGHTVVIRGDGTVWAWGGNSSGQLGDGTVSESLNTPAAPYTPRPIPAQTLGPEGEGFLNLGTAPNPPTEFTVLQTAVTAALARNEADYTSASWVPFVNARSAAQTVLNNADATQTQVDDALATLKAAQAALVPTGPPPPLFPDVRADHWGRAFVLDAHASGFMNGNPDGTFAPYGQLTRAQAAQTLANIAGVGTPGVLPRPTENPFRDVPTHAWYAPVIYWASERNIMNGHADGRFAPGEPITREQFAVILRNLAAYQGYDTRSPADGGAQWPFSDGSSISWWAVDAVRWANYYGIILGDAHGFRPGDVPFRVEAATMVVRFDRADLPDAPEPEPDPPIDFTVWGWAQWQPYLSQYSSSVSLPDRRLTDGERQAWIAEYQALGGVSAFELEVIRLVNEIRVAHGLATLELDETLAMAARFYAYTMAYFDTTLGHNEGPYRVPDAVHGASANVAEAFGGRLRWGGGNGAAGHRSPQILVNGWMNSAGHRDYILSPEHRFIGPGTHLGGQWDMFHYLFLSDQSSID